MLKRALLIAITAAVMATTSLAGAIDVLTPKDVDDAIALGVRGNPAPYVLRHAGSNATRPDPVVVGAVYTPFLRVALFAKTKYSAGYNITRDDIPPKLLEPVVQVAFRWYSFDAGTDQRTFNPFARTDLAILAPGSPRFRYLHPTTAPIEISHDLSVLSEFGGELPYHDVVILATYPMGALSMPGDFVIYRETPSERVPGGKDAELRIGRVTPEDIARWK